MTPVTSVSAGKAFCPAEGSSPIPRRSTGPRVQGLGAHRPSEASAPRGPGGGGASRRRPLPRPAVPTTPAAGRGCGACQRACARMPGGRRRGLLVALPSPGVSARPISQPPQRGADAACGAGYPECSARGQLTGVWFSRRRQRRRRLRWLLLLLWWRRRPGPQPRPRLPFPPPPRVPSFPGAAGNMKLRSRRSASE